MDPDERRKRHELSYGLYNFRDVKVHFSRLGWTFRPGPPLSYDHYYIKPGKNPRNKNHKRGTDFFLGEAELVAYARKMNIFGVEMKSPSDTNKPEHRKQQAHSQNSSNRTQVSQTTLVLSSEGSDGESTRREHKRPRQQLNENKVENSAHNPIALLSDSSSDDLGNESVGNTMTSVQSSEEEEWSVEPSNDESDEEEEKCALNDDPNDELSIRTGSTVSDQAAWYQPRSPAPLAAPANGKSCLDQREKRKKQCEAKEKLSRTPGSICDAKHAAASDVNDVEQSQSIYQTPRPLLTTSHTKRRAGMHCSTNQHKAKPRAHANGSQGQKKAARSFAFVTQKCVDNTHSYESNGSDDTGSAFAAYSASPPRRPPSRVHSRAKRSRPLMATKTVDASVPPVGQVKETLLARYPFKDTNTLVPERASFSFRLVPSNVKYPSSGEKSTAEHAYTPAQVFMELTHVVLPPANDARYYLKVTVSADNPPVHTIWMENLSSHAQHEASFVDVMELPGAKQDTRVPTRSVLTALFRCLSSQMDVVVIVGPEPRAMVQSKTASEKGEVHLLRSTAGLKPHKAKGESSDDSTLVVTYPALDLFRIDHPFPMKLVPTDQQVQHLAREVERLRQQLYLVQTDRNKLCEQLRQQEEENERKRSQLAAAQAKMKAHHVQ